tara:strand:- start:20847 stop:21761 length:915 start_codon:yes stop_codon:yes gene_type:complete
MPKITIITCTKDRPHELVNLLNSMREQTSKPYRHIIVDGSDNPAPVASLVEEYTDLPIEYYTLRPPGLTRQKNFALSKLDAATDWVGVLDDDVILAPSALEQIALYSDANPQVKGIGLTFSNIKPRKLNPIRNLFLLDSKKSGSFTISGIPSTVHDNSKLTPTKWLHGGATFWDKVVFENFKFDEWYSGVGYLEDIDFSYTVSRKYPLVYLPSANCIVNDPPMPESKMRKAGCWQIVATWYFVSKNTEFKKLLTAYSLFGVFLFNSMIGVLKPKSKRLLSAAGNLDGFWIIISGRTYNHTGFQK